MAIRVKAIGNPSMMMKMNRNSIDRPICGSVMLRLLGPVGARLLAALALQLLLVQDHAFGLLHVVQPLRPLAVADAQDAADDLGDALQQQEHPGDGDQRLERKHGDARRAEDAHLAEPDGEGGIVPAGVDPGGNGGQEEQDVEQRSMTACVRGRQKR